MEPASTDDICKIISRCEDDPKLQVLRNLVRVIANTGLRNGEFASLRESDIDPAGTLLHVGRPRTIASSMRMLPLRPRTYAALVSLHILNPESEFVLGDCPRTRFDYMIRKLKIIAPQFARAGLWTYSIRLNYESRLISAGIPMGIVKYLLGRESLRDSLGELSLTDEQKVQIVRRSVERFLQEL